ncbi:MAG TPA: energy transducer TonB [Gemmatimonadaceae bacterium]
MTNDDSNRTISIALRVTMVVALGLLAACSKGDATRTAFDASMSRPDTYPIMLNKDMPFRYPPALYAEKVQGNVTLRLYVDKDGSVVDDSTRVIESSNIAPLDSAAINGSRELKFEPAKLRGTPMPVSILFPVYFRHPDAPPPPGDSILKKIAPPGTDSAATAAAKATTDSATSRKSRSSTTKHRRKPR